MTPASRNSSFKSAWGSRRRASYPCSKSSPRSLLPLLSRAYAWVNNRKRISRMPGSDDVTASSVPRVENSAPEASATSSRWAFSGPNSSPARPESSKARISVKDMASKQAFLRRGSVRCARKSALQDGANNTGFGIRRISSAKSAPRPPYAVSCPA